MPSQECDQIRWKRFDIRCCFVNMNGDGKIYRIGMVNGARATRIGRRLTHTRIHSLPQAPSPISFFVIIAKLRICDIAIPELAGSERMYLYKHCCINSRDHWCDLICDF